MLSILLLAGLTLAYPLKSFTETQYQGTERLYEQSQAVVHDVLSSGDLPLEHQILRRGLSKKSISNGSDKIPELYYIRPDEVDTIEKRKGAIARYEDVLHEKESDRQIFKKKYIKYHDVISAGDHERTYRELGTPRWMNHGVQENHKLFQTKDKELDLEISKLKHDLKALNY